MRVPPPTVTLNTAQSVRIRRNFIWNKPPEQVARLFQTGQRLALIRVFVVPIAESGFNKIKAEFPASRHWKNHRKLNPLNLQLSNFQPFDLN